MEMRKILQEFRIALEDLYGARLKKILLYGSWARGEATERSDIDLAIVLQGQFMAGKEIDRMIGIVTDMGLKYGVLLSVYPVSEENYAGLNSPLLLNIRREGIPA
jgi:predicted nucleotidyltransferase